MAEDYYKTLGVPQNASQADIQKAYRELARKYHPDMNPDDKTAKKKFQQIQAAFDVLNNPEKREMYDRYGSSFETMGAGRPQAETGLEPGGRGRGRSSAASRPRTSTSASSSASDSAGDARRAGRHLRPVPPRRLAARAQGRGRGQPPRGRHHLRGRNPLRHRPSPAARCKSPSSARPARPRRSCVKIPPGIEDGKKIRLRGQGEPAAGGGTPGDILLTVHVRRTRSSTAAATTCTSACRSRWARRSAGAKVDVPTPSGTVALSVPPGTSSGTKLRVKGHGVAPKNGPPGDLLAEIQIVLPAGLSDAERDQIRQIDQRTSLQPSPKPPVVADGPRSDSRGRTASPDAATSSGRSACGARPPTRRCWSSAMPTACRWRGWGCRSRAKSAGRWLRNRWKRRIREAFRLASEQLPRGIDLVVIPRATQEPPLDQIRESLVRLAGRVARKVPAPGRAEN